jgi:hypothetical protein
MRYRESCLPGQFPSGWVRRTRNRGANSVRNLRTWPRFGGVSSSSGSSAQLLRFHICPAVKQAKRKKCRARVSHRQRQYLSVTVELAHRFGMTHSKCKEVSGELADASAALGGHLAQAGVNDRCGTYLDLFAIAFVRLSHSG